MFKKTVFSFVCVVLLLGQAIGFAEEVKPEIAPLMICQGESTSGGTWDSSGKSTSYVIEKGVSETSEVDVIPPIDPTFHAEGSSETISQGESKGYGESSTVSESHSESQSTSVGESFTGTSFSEGISENVDGHSEGLEHHSIGVSDVVDPCVDISVLKRGAAPEERVYSMPYGEPDVFMTTSIGAEMTAEDQVTVDKTKHKQDIQREHDDLLNTMIWLLVIVFIMQVTIISMLMRKNN